jgi:hypothetical protein
MEVDVYIEDGVARTTIDQTFFNHTDYQLEVWVAPEQDWYPVKIMYADRKGTSLGLTLSKIEKK